MKTKIYWLGGILTLLALSVTFFSPSPLPLSPLCTSSADAPEQCRKTLSDLGDPARKSYIILGFAPYWNLKKLTPASLTSITHLAYFNLHLNGDGSLYTKINRREEDPGYTNYKRLLTQTIDIGTKPLIVTFMPESQTALTSSISTPINRQKAGLKGSTSTTNPLVIAPLLCATPLLSLSKDSTNLLNLKLIITNLY